MKVKVALLNDWKFELVVPDHYIKGDEFLVHQHLQGFEFVVLDLHCSK
jgi:hypothetical protein